MLPVMEAWPPNTGFTSRQAKKVQIKNLSEKKPSIADRTDASNDWVVLEILDEQAAIFGCAVMLSEAFKCGIRA